LRARPLLAGWLAAQQTLEKTQAELQASRVQIGELEGRLGAAAAVSAEIASSKQTIRKLESHVTSSEARMQV
jgi:prefoldin subunit 5